jgi:hypothetical protein
MKMENFTINGNGVNLEALRKGVAEAVKRAYGAERNYAKALNALFSFDWFDLEAHDTTDNGKAVKAEKTLLYTELKAAEHTNPSTVWARIRKYGKEERHGAEDVAEDSEAGAGNSARDPMTRNVQELIDLYKFNARQEELPEKVKQAQAHIVQALKALGVDLNLIK